MASRGRPKGSGKYNKQYRLRLTENQKEKLQELADKNNTTSADILRVLVEKAFERS